MKAEDCKELTDGHEVVDIHYVLTTEAPDGSLWLNIEVPNLDYGTYKVVILKGD